MDELRIDLKNNIESYREIYFPNGSDSLFRYTRKLLIITLVFLAATALLTTTAIDKGEDTFTYLAIAAGIISFFLFIAVLGRISKFYKWKKPIDKYLSDISSYKTYSLALGPAAIEIIIDGNVYIQKWENVKNTTILPEYISIENNEQQMRYIFPAKCMRSHEYDKMKLFIRNVLKNTAG
jgi:hypothetical protein